MSSALEKEEEKAFQEYQDAVEKLSQLRCPTRKSTPGGKIVFIEWNEEYFKKVKEAGAKVAEMLKKWDESLRRLYGSHG